MKCDFKKMMSWVLSFAMIFSMIPTAVFAAEVDESLCAHHAEHTEECGYVKAVAEVPCNHEHTAECYTQGVLPDADSSDAYEVGADVNALDCRHEHDETCGYAAAVEACACQYDCGICSVQDLINALATAEDYLAMEDEDQIAVQEELLTVYEAYAALSAEEQAEVDAAALYALRDAVMNGGEVLADTPEAMWGDSAEALTDSGTLDEAVAASPAYIQLQTNITRTSSVTFNHTGDITLDLNGKTLSGSTGTLLILNSGNLTIVDTAEDGKIDASAGGNAVGLGNGTDAANSVLKIESGTIIAKNYAVLASNGTVYLNGGTLQSISDCAVSATYGDVVVVGSNLISEKAMIFCYESGEFDYTIDLSEATGDSYTFRGSTYNSSKIDRVKLPEGWAFYNSSDSIFDIDTETLNAGAVITAKPKIYYISLGGKQLTAAYKEDEGWNYDSDTNTLYITDDVTISTGDDPALESKYSGLNIHIASGKTLSLTGNQNTVVLNDDSTISGGGSMIVKNGDGATSSVYVDGSLNISNITLNATATATGGNAGVALCSIGQMTFENVTATIVGQVHAGRSPNCYPVSISGSSAISIYSSGDRDGALSASELTLSNASHLKVWTDSSDYLICANNHIPIPVSGGYYRTNSDGDFSVGSASVTLNGDIRYFEYIGADHVGEAKQNSDGTTHSKSCTCSIAAVVESEACSGGTATCSAKAVCTVCGGSYGELGDEHIFDADGRCACGFQVYNLWIGGERVTSGNAPDVFDDGKVSYNPTENILTLNGYIYTGPGYAAIDYGGTDTLTLMLEGTSSVTHSGNASGTSFGVLAMGSIIVDGTGSLTVTNGNVIGVGRYGVYAEGDITVKGGSLTATGGTATNESYGVKANGSITVKGGSLTGTAGTAGFSYGVKANGNITVEDGSLNGFGGEATFSYGVYTDGNITVFGEGNLTATGGTAANESYGVFVNSIAVSGKGSLSGIGGEATVSRGVCAFDDITVEGDGSLTATGGEASSVSIGVDAGGIFTVKGGEVIAQGGEVAAEGYTQAFLKAPTVFGGFTNAAVWYGDSKEDAIAAGVKNIGELEKNCYQKYVKIAENKPHTVNIDTRIINGKVEADATEAPAGTTVTLTVQPDKGYKLGTLTVTGASGTVETRAVDGGNYAFTMPAEAVTVSATFTACDHSGSQHTTATNKGDGTHSFTCTVCGAAMTEDHDHTNGKCICGVKATPVVTAPTAKTNLIYSGTEQELIDAGSTTGGTLQYSLDSATWSNEIPTAIKADTYTVYYKVVGNDDYEDVAAQSITVTINPNEDYTETVTTTQDVIREKGAFVAPNYTGVGNELVSGTYVYTYGGTEYDYGELVEMLKTLEVDTTASVGYTFTPTNRNYTGSKTGTLSLTIRTIKFTVNGATATAENAIVRNGAPVYGDTLSDRITINGELTAVLLDATDYSPNSFSFSCKPGDPLSVGTQTIQILYNGTMYGVTYQDVVVCEFEITVAPKSTTVTPPADVTLDFIPATVDEVIEKLPTTVVNNNPALGETTFAITWSCDNLNTHPNGTSTFTWTITDEKLDNYAADVNSGTITVTNRDYYSVTNTGAKQTITYNGSTYDVASMFTKDTNAGEASYEIIGGSGAGDLNGSVLEITKAGTIELKMTTAANGNYAAGDAIATLTVNKANGAGTVSMDGWTYGEDAKAPTTENGTGTATFLYTGSGYSSAVVPTNAGTYTVTATFAENDLYKTATASDTFTIKQKEVTPSISGSVSKTYDGTTIVPDGLFITLDGIITGDDVSATATCAYESADVGTTRINATDITLTGTDAGNYTLKATTASAEVGTITKADPSYEVPTGLSATYGDTLATVILPDGFAWEDELTTAVGNVGNSEFTVTYTPGDTLNYKTVTGIAVSIEVKAAAASIATAPTAISGLIYNKTSQELITAGTANGGELQYSLDNQNWSADISTGTEADTYTVYYKVVGDENHSNSNVKSVEVTIAKAKATITVNTTAINVTYGDTVTLPTATSNFGTVTCDKTAGDLVNAGTYTVTYSVEGTDNYYGDTKSLTVTISKADGSLNAPTAKTGLVYTESALELINEGSSTTGTMQYKLDNGTYSTDIPKATNAGTYTVFYKVVGDANHDDVDEQSFTVTIGKAKANITVDTADIVVTYGETVDLPEATTNFGTVACDKTAANLVNAGNYTVTYTVEGTDNYDGDTKSVTVTINPKAITEADVELVGTLTYNGNEQIQQVNPKNGITCDVTGNTATEADTYTLTITGNGNYTGEVKLSYTVAKKPISVVWENTNLVYTGSAQSPAAKLAGVVAGNNVQAVVSGSGTNAGTYDATVSLSGEDADNYALTGNTKFTIARAPVTFKVSNNSVEEGKNISVAVTSDPANVSHTVTYRQNGSVVTPSAVGEYEIFVEITDSNYRHSASANGDAIKIGVLTIYEGKKPATYTLSYAPGEGSGTMAAEEAALAGTIRILPECTFTAPKDSNNNDMLFVGWTDGNATYKAGEQYRQPEKNVTMTALWVAEEHTINGMVKQFVSLDSTELVNRSGVVVTLMLGSKQVAQAVTDANGNYKFEHCLLGTYNLVAEYEGIRQTAKAVLGHSDMSDLEIDLPAGKTNSTVDVEPGTPDIVVGGLDEMMKTTDDKVFTEADKEVVEQGGEVEIKMEVKENPAPEKKDDLEKKAEEISTVTEIGIFIDLDLTKTVTDKDGNTVGEENKVIEEASKLLENIIFLPGHLQNKNVYHVFRDHGGKVEEMTELRSVPTGNTEGFIVDRVNHTITIYAMKYSTYAIAYTDPFTVTFNANGGKVDVESAITGTDGTLESLPTPTRSGYTFKGWFTAESGGTEVTTDTVFNADKIIYAQWQMNYVPTPSGGNTNKVTVDAPENGSVNADLSSAKEGTTVIITVVPDEGYELDKLTVTDAKGNELKVTSRGNDRYSFVMPDSKVSIKATFVTESEECTGGDNCLSAQFSDLDPSLWYHNAIDFVLDNGMMSGYPGNLFGPNDSITRGQIVTILHRLEGTPVVNYLMTYEDVNQGMYYAEAIRWATSEGIVAGYGNGKFGPDDPITRQQLATILWRYSQHKGYDVSVGEDTNILSYEDAFDISEYAIPAMQWACGAGVMGGYGNGYLGPNDGATRAQAAQMLKNYLMNL